LDIAHIFNTNYENGIEIYIALLVIITSAACKANNSKFAGYFKRAHLSFLSLQILKIFG